LKKRRGRKGITQQTLKNSRIVTQRKQHLTSKRHNSRKGNGNLPPKSARPGEEELVTNIQSLITISPETKKKKR